MDVSGGRGLGWERGGGGMESVREEETYMYTVRFAFGGA